MKNNEFQMWEYVLWWNYITCILCSDNIIWEGYVVYTMKLNI